MTTDVKRWDTGVYGIQYMEQDPNGAFVEYEDYQKLIAENERLRAEVTEARDGWRMANGAADLAMKHRDAAEAQAERLAEALRELLEIGDRYTGDQDEDAAIYCAVTDNARAALDQEGGNG